MHSCHQKISNASRSRRGVKKSSCSYLCVCVYTFTLYTYSGKKKFVLEDVVGSSSSSSRCVPAYIHPRLQLLLPALPGKLAQPNVFTHVNYVKGYLDGDLTHHRHTHTHISTLHYYLQLPIYSGHRIGQPSTRSLQCHMRHYSYQTYSFHRNKTKNNCLKQPAKKSSIHSKNERQI